MEDRIIFIYCLADAVVKNLNLKEQPLAKMSNAEIITFVVVSALYHQCNYKFTRLLSIHLNLFSALLSESRLCRRIHRIPKSVWLMIFAVSRSVVSTKRHFIVDSFPVASCQNNKSFRCRLFRGKKFHGYTASKKQFFFGLKVHMIVSAEGIPIEFVFTPGGESDIRGLHRLKVGLPENSLLFGDKAYTDYALEDFLMSGPKICLVAKRKKNSRRKHDPDKEWLLSITRNRIETTFSSIASLMPRWIRARTERGFCLKLMFFILACTIKLSHF